MLTRPRSELYIIIPAFNEAAVIADTVRSVSDGRAHVVVVDDCSRDETGARARAAGATVLRHPVNLGQGAALQTGIAHAVANGAGYVATFDADGQHSPSDLYAMLDLLIEKRLDVVVGSRFLGATRNMPALRRVVLRAALLFTRLTSGLRLSDTHNGLRVMTADSARRLNITQNRMAHASEILDRIGALKLRYAEAPVTIHYSKYSLAKGQKLSGAVEILIDLCIGWMRK